jgi:hypothetical protein
LKTKTRKKSLNYKSGFNRSGAVKELQTDPLHGASEWSLQAMKYGKEWMPYSQTYAVPEGGIQCP